MKDSFSSALISVFFSRVMVLGIAFFFTPVLVRLIGPTQFGQYALVLSVFGIVNVVINSGTSDAVRKYISERSDPTWQAAVYGYVFRPALALGVLTSAAFAIAAWLGLAAYLFGEAFTSLFYLLGAYAIASQLAYHNLRTLMGLELESRSEPLKVLRKVLFVILALAFIYVGLGVDGLLIAHIAASVAIFVIASIFVVRQISIRSILSPPEIDLPKRQITAYIGNTILFFLFLYSLYHVDVILLQYWMTDEVVGYYRGALSIAEFLWLAPITVQLVLLQRISHLWAIGDVGAIQRQAQFVTRYVFLFTSLLAIGLAVLATDFVPLYLGSDFTPSITPLLVLLPGVLGFALARPTLAINQGRRSLRPLLAATGGCALVNVVLNVVLIPPFGMVGAAVATSIGYASLVVFQARAARHLGYRPLAGLRPAPIALTLLGSGVAIFAIGAAIPSPLLSLALVPPLGAAVYVVVAIATTAIEPEEVRMILDRVGVLPGTVERRILFVVDRIPRL